MLSIEVLQKALPDKYKKQVNQELLDNIHQVLNDPELFDTFKENFITYTSVLTDGKYKMTDYLNAVKYCTHKLMGHSNQDSYIKTFPNRYQRMIQQGMSAKDISSFVSIYNKSKLVNAIMEQSMIPSWIINQDLYQKAINVQAELMMTAQSEKVRSDAANSLLIHLKPPEVKKVELDIGLKQNSELSQLKELTAQLASQQRKLIESGVVDATHIAKTKLVIDGEYNEVNE